MPSRAKKQDVQKCAKLDSEGENEDEVIILKEISPKKEQAGAETSFLQETRNICANIEGRPKASMSSQLGKRECQTNLLSESEEAMLQGKKCTHSAQHVYNNDEVVQSSSCNLHNVLRIMWPSGKLSSTPPQDLVGGWRKVWVTESEASKGWAHPHRANLDEHQKTDEEETQMELQSGTNSSKAGKEEAHMELSSGANSTKKEPQRYFEIFSTAKSSPPKKMRIAEDANPDNSELASCIFND